MTNNISIRHLRAFIEIAATGSFTRAADNLHLTQSTLTATIKQLEEQAGLKLLDRTTRRVLLTGKANISYPLQKNSSQILIPLLTICRPPQVSSKGK